MKHYIKTAAGVSRGFIKWANIDEDMEIVKTNINGLIEVMGNIGGVGQGGGASPVEWLTVLLVMIDTFKQFSTGAQIVDPMGVHGFTMALLSYVDDNSLLKSLPSDMPANQVFEQISKEMLQWKRILRVT